MKKLLFIFIVILFNRSYAQHVAINTSGNAADESAMLDISSPDKGLLIPRVNLASLTDAVTITSPATGLLIYNNNATLGTGFYYNSNTALSPIWIKLATASSSAGWELGGNSVAVNDFIGTTNSQPLKFKVNNELAGIIEHIKLNTAFGYQSFNNNSSGNYNSVYGAKAMFSNIAGSSNTAMGYQVLYSNQGGGNNLALGNNSLFNNTYGNSNIAVGSYTLYNNISGNHNVALGESALFENISGVANIAIGNNSMYLTQSGFSNIALGYNTLYNHKKGDHNIATGAYALNHDTSGTVNIATGLNALYNNLDGSDNISFGWNSLYNNVSGNDNIAIGKEALSDNQASGNIAVGYQSLSFNSTGDKNTAIGYQSLKSNGIGYQNTAIGYNALNTNTTGFKNTAIGYAAFTSNNSSNSTAIGANAEALCNDCLVLGSTIADHINVGIGTDNPQKNLHINPKGAGGILIGTNNTGGYTNLEMGVSQQSGGYSYIQSSSASGVSAGNLLLNPGGGKVGIRNGNPTADLHIKQSTETYPVNGGGLRLERLNTTNHWDIGTDNGDDLNFVYNGSGKAYLSDANGELVTGSDIRLKKDIRILATVLPLVMQLEAKTYHYKDNKDDAPLSYGFIAQEVEKLFPDFVFTKGEDKMKAIAYQNFSVIAIKAIQEQQKEIESLKEYNRTMIEKQQQIIQQLEERMKLLERKIN